MTDSHDIVIAPPVQIEQRQKMNPLVEVALSKSDGAIDIDLMRDLMALNKEWEAEQAKKSYTRAMIELKKELPTFIEHDRDVDYVNSKGVRTHYTHSSLASATDATVPLLSNYGFSHSWIPSVNDNCTKVTVECVITHVDGHRDSCKLSAPPDSKGGKSPAQAIESTNTILQRYTFLAILGVATKDMREPHGPSEEDMNRIDITKNSEVMGTLSRYMTYKEACGHVQKDIREWTTADHKTLGDFARSIRDGKANTPKNTTAIPER